MPNHMQCHKLEAINSLKTEIHPNYAQSVTSYLTKSTLQGIQSIINVLYKNALSTEHYRTQTCTFCEQTLGTTYFKSVYPVHSYDELQSIYCTN
jgi:hypothetical protein